MFNFLKSNKFFKLICAAGNEDLEQVEKLVYIYAKVGCRFFDVAADKCIVQKTKQTIGKINSDEKIFVCISVGSKNDPHIQKAFITSLCKNCQKCAQICPQNAIFENKIDPKKCIGCQKCIKICPHNAIKTEAKKQNFEEFLPEIIALGIDCIEFHVSDFTPVIFEQWNWLNKNFDGILSVSIGQNKLKKSEIIEILNKFLSQRKPFTTIIQADGIPMSADKNDEKTTQNCIKTGLFIQEQNYSAFLNLAGGTNLLTAKLASIAGLKFDGIAFGTFARNAVKEYIRDKNFWKNPDIQQEAVISTQKIFSNALNIK